MAAKYSGEDNSHWRAQVEVSLFQNQTELSEDAEGRLKYMPTNNLSGPSVKANYSGEFGIVAKTR